MNNIQKYIKDLDTAYTEAVQSSLTDIREGIKECDDEIHDTQDPDKIQELEDTISILQEVLKAAQSNLFFIEQTPPSVKVLSTIREKLSDEDLETVLGWVQDPRYKQFMEVSYAAEQAYNESIKDYVDSFMDSLSDNSKH